MEDYEVEERAEIFQLVLNRMERGTFEKDVFEKEFSSLSPKNILFFKLCIEYKRILQADYSSLWENKDLKEETRNLEVPSNLQTGNSLNLLYCHIIMMIINSDEDNIFNTEFQLLMSSYDR